jgi:hypothetical protein
VKPEEAWGILGIAPTDDAGAIRGAYAARLKAIDPETDPQAFIALRAAFDAVRGHGAWTVEPITERPAPISAAGQFDPVRPPEQADPAPAAELARDEADAHAREITRLLYGHEGHDPWLATEVQQLLIDHWRALASDPRMEEIAFRDRVERWAAIVIAETSPLSAPILMLAAEQFGWIDADRTARSDPHVAEIARRYRMLRLLHAANTPRGRHSAAWKELTTPADPFSSHGRVDPHLVFEVLAAMRYALPELEGTFDPLRVSSWEGYVGSGYVPVPGETAGGCLWGMVKSYLLIVAACMAIMFLILIGTSIASFFE